MATEAQTDRRATQNSWNQITEALLLGFVAFSVLVVHTFVHGIGAPEGSGQLFAWVTALGVISYPLLRWDFKAGYALTILTGLLTLVFLGILMTGILGTLQPFHPIISIVLGPVTYAAFAVILIIATSLAWRERGDI